MLYRWSLLWLLLGATSAVAQSFTWPPHVNGDGRFQPVLGRDQEWNLVAGAVGWPDGRVLVAEVSTSTLTMFGPKGAVLWQFGRPGEGPGEFRRLRGLARCVNGEIAAWDAGLRRLTLVTDAGEVVRSEARPDVAGSHLLACSSGAEFFVDAQRPQGTPPPAVGGSFQTVMDLVRVRGPQLESLGTAYGISVMTSEISATDLPFGERAVLTVGGDVAYSCQAGLGSCAVRRLSAPGATQRWTIGLPTREVTDAHWTRAYQKRERMLAAMQEPGRSVLLQALADTPRQKTFGQFETAIADDLGRLWIKTYERYGTPAALWLVVTPTGRPIATVALPDVLEPTHILRDRVIGVARDDDGVPTVHQYTYVLPAGEGFNRSQ